MKTIYSWHQKKYPPPNRKLLKKLLEETIGLSGLAGGGALSFSFVDAPVIEGINSDFVGHHGITDVISFDYRSGDSDTVSGGGEDIAAEIIICVDKAAAEGRKRRTSSFSEELVLYIVHGVLHIAGEDDLDPEKRKNMRKQEKRIMECLKKKFRFSDIFGNGKIENE